MHARVSPGPGAVAIGGQGDTFLVLDRDLPAGGSDLFPVQPPHGNFVSLH